MVKPRAFPFAGYGSVRRIEEEGIREVWWPSVERAARARGERRLEAWG
ncbi:hypothetical protein ES288_A10G096500v1 [Gossypium darwinii]|uniref:Uncharacterized protein n=1 Tax=Gossypium darwinii TaxID=34276 RepID=A0A5D2EY82_GOSDA|nr:hypothetical protein ES288_A10G096500v1 [Gossypium darwinii]